MNSFTCGFVSRCALAAAFAFSLSRTAVAAGLPQFDPGALRPTREHGEYSPALRGNWLLSGYGHLYRIKRGGADIYSHAGGLCWFDPIATPDAGQLLAWYARSWLRLDTAFADSREGMQYHIDPLAALPPACTRPIDRTTPAYTFDAMANLFIDYFPYAAERGVDFVQRKSQLRPLAAAARDDAELAAVFAEFVAGFDDPHTGANVWVDGQRIELGQRRGGPTVALLRERFAASGADDFDAWLAQWAADQNAKIDALLDPATRRRVFGDSVAWGVLPDNIGYLAFDSMIFVASNEADNRAAIRGELDAALTALKDTRAIVVDVSANGGGIGLVSSDIAGRFADRRRLAYTKQARGVRRAAPHAFHAIPSGAVRYAKPVVLLTSDLTVSAGELFTLFMRALPQVVHVGTRTQGAVSGAFPHGLPNGWEVGFPTEVTRDAQGRVYEATGIPPQTTFDVFPRDGFDDGRVDAIRRAAGIAAAQPASGAAIGQ